MWGAIALLLVAIGVEVVSTSLLPRTEGFTQLNWSLLVIAGFTVAIWLLSVVVQKMQVSVAYAIWSGAGTAFVALIATVFLGEQMTVFKALCLAMIIAGVIGLNLAGTAH